MTSTHPSTGPAATGPAADRQPAILDRIEENLVELATVCRDRDRALADWRQRMQAGRVSAISSAQGHRPVDADANVGWFALRSGAVMVDSRRIGRIHPGELFTAVLRRASQRLHDADGGHEQFGVKEVTPPAQSVVADPRAYLQS